MNDNGRDNYDATFLAMMDDHAGRSAAAVVPLVQSVLQVGSLADFGCGRGEWLRVWQQHRVDDVTGLDGDYISPAELSIAAENYRAADLSQPIRLGRRFDLVQALEVAEHLPESSADTFVDTLAAHSRQILFSAAVPGQMGIQHVNEQPFEYWRDKFAEREFHLIDWIRPRLVGRSDVSYWYRQNILFFVHASKLKQLLPALAAHRVPKSGRVPRYAPISFGIRCSLTRWLPVPITDLLVHQMMRRSHGREGLLRPGAA